MLQSDGHDDRMMAMMMRLRCESCSRLNLIVNDILDAASLKQNTIRLVNGKVEVCRVVSVSDVSARV